jgi:hypothetical protein
VIVLLYIGISESPNIEKRHHKMLVETYRGRVTELFKSGGATEAQWDELGETVLTAAEDGLTCVRNIEKAVGMDREAEMAEIPFGPAGESLDQVWGRIQEHNRRLEMAGDRRWKATMLRAKARAAKPCR